MSPAERIKVVCRVRPFIPNEAPDDSVYVDGNYIELDNQRNPTKRLKFSFASLYSEKATQSDIFENDVQPLIERVFDGYDATIFAYGVTGSGKTYTMDGVRNEPGIIPRVADFLFQAKNRPQIADLSVTMSYMEIFKESVYDLLVMKGKTTPLDIREDQNRNIFVANLTEHSVYSINDFHKIFRLLTSLSSIACRNRSTATTKLNAHSSRSHAILTFNVTVTIKNSYYNSNGDVRTIFGKINLIDLAGSEDNRRSGNTKERMDESTAINKSLFVLGQVVEALNSGSSRIPFRDSKMTRILQPTLGGSSLGMMIINIAPGHSHFLDTLNTLNFATRSKEIRSRPKQNSRRLTKTGLITAYPSPDRDTADENPRLKMSLKRPFDAHWDEMRYHTEKRFRHINPQTQLQQYSNQLQQQSGLSVHRSSRYLLEDDINTDDRAIHSASYIPYGTSSMTNSGDSSSAVIMLTEEKLKRICEDVASETEKKLSTLYVSKV
ncbi:hypothetical protein DFQ28_004697 [Apophysomyces sp. BC1034]|nr:hypothetical protein DFQ28_004697 [Apophysomyces sp. BC1034]